MPTLLSTVTKKKGKIVLAHSMHNSAYDQLRNSDSFLTDEYMRNPVDSIKLDVDKDSILFGEPLTLRWELSNSSGQSQRSKYASIVETTDVFALYCPAGSTDYSRFKEALTFEQVLLSHEIHQDATDNSWYIPSFPIIREESCEFILWRKSGGGFQMKGKTQNFQIENGRTTPTAIHLALTREPTEIRVQFTTGIPGIPTVLYGLSKNNLIMMMTGSSTTYGAADMCEEPANVTAPGKFQDPGYLHNVILQGLEPDVVYFYKVRIEDGLWSDIKSFRASPVLGPDTEFSFLTFADQGCPDTGWTGKGSTSVANIVADDVHRNGARFSHIVGDLSYADGAGHVYDAWFQMNENFTAYTPLMITIGNHEYDHDTGGIGKDPSGVNSAGGYHPTWSNFHDEGGECGVPIDRRFTMPSNGNGVFWYSYDFGSVHIVSISSEHDLRPNSEQHEWFQQDLASVDRDATPWLIVTSHRPLYEPEIIPDEFITIEHIREEIEDIVYEFEVDLFLSGHYHSYFRSCPGLYRYKCNNFGTQYITVGTGGANMYFGTIDNPYTPGLYKNDWTEFFTKKFGYGRVSILNSTSLHWEFIGTDGSVIDDTWITK